MAEFIRQRCAITEPVDLHRVWCPACDFSFYDQRLDDTETERLYRGYRQDEYNRLRTELEPSYAELVPVFEDRHNPYHLTRQAQTKALFDAWEVPIQTVLDFGGEPDAWMPRAIFPGREIVAYDLSDDSEMPAGRGFDLVFCAHVLEHVSFPLAFLASLRPFVRPGGFLYVEIPIEYPEGSLRNTIRTDHGLNYMHEHISQYSPLALARALTRGGFTPLDVRYLGDPFASSLAILAALPTVPLEIGDRLGRHATLPSEELEELVRIWAFQQLERHGDAILLLESFLQRHSSHAVALTTLGRSFLRLEDPETAEACLTAALEADPTYTPSFLHLARLLAIKGDVSTARDLLNAGLDQNPGSLLLCRESMRLSALAHSRQA